MSAELTSLLLAVIVYTMSCMYMVRGCTFFLEVNFIFETAPSFYLMALR